ncbi:metallophosphoesterase [Thalassovita taeanensis]|uniref:Calcineurin-like phosphoesterase n=1 Tax=Thalassovita taeanensis TaxID=657014 RepID=A0A1H9JWV9_9RHOB|nr:metallophosphoesterase [Thalassovita taeanensis]SEQ91244.1 Calcineurin-like phosphoesterase [Thalassovita taeanensis]
MLKIIVMSDVHILPEGVVKHGLDTSERFAIAIDDANTFHDDADLCIYAGDIADEGDAASYARFEALRAGNPIPSFVMMGNHDNRPTYLETASDPMVDDNGFVQGIADIKGYRVIMLDSSEPGRVDGVLCNDRLAWLAARLAEAKDRDLPVILVLHHPANRLHMPVDTYGLTDADKLASVLLESGARIAQIVAGHCHIPTAGSWHGIPVATISGNQHRVGLHLRNMTRQQPCYEGAAQFAVLLATTSGVTVHFHNYVDRNVQLPDAMFPWKRVQKFGPED